MTEAGGRIYDLGYQGYDGPRLGRAAAVRALFWHTLRSAYGLGRGGRAKIAPFSLAAIALLPAIVAVGIAALAAQAGPAGEMIEDASPIRYATYNGGILTLVILFCAAQAPELLGRDQRHGVLPVYFARALSRLDYVTAKVGGFMAALFAFIVVPHLLLFIGRVMAAPDPAAGLAEELPSMPAVVGQAALMAGLLGGIAMAVSAFTPRRAFATAAIIAAFIVPPIVVGLLLELGSADLAEVLVLLSPTDVLDGSNATLFGALPESPAILRGDLPGLLFVAVALAAIAAVSLLTVRRYLRIAA